MTEERKRTAMDDWLAVEDLQAQVELEDMLADSPETRRQELRALGIAPEQARQVGEDLLAKARAELGLVTPSAVTPPGAPMTPPGARVTPPGAPMIPLHGSTVAPPSMSSPASRRPRSVRAAYGAPVAWSVLLAAAALLAVLSWKHQEIAAWWTGDHGPGPAPTPVPESTLAQAIRVRGDALAACDRRDWPSCEAGLDKAKELDPPGDLTPRVVLARQALYDATHENDPLEAKPK